MGKKDKSLNKSMDTSMNGDVEDAGGKSWDEKVAHLNPIAKPLASRKLAKKIYKTIKKAYKVKQLDIGIKNVQKSLKKGGKGLVVFAGDVHPVDVICHLPLVCEEAGIPYCYVPSRDDLGGASGQNRQASVMLIKPNDEFKENYDEVVTSVQQLPPPL